MTTPTNPGNVPFEVARLTPIGRGAVACVGVRGDGAWPAFLQRWSRVDGRPVGAEFENWTPDSATRPFFGRFRLDGFGGESEEIVLRRRTATAFELNGHGGDVVSSAVVRFFVERGATEIPGDRWERAVERDERPIFSGETRLETLFFAAADALLAETTTETTAKIALDQREIWRDWFAKFAAELKSRRENAHNLTDLTTKIAAVAEKFALGRRLTEPFVVLLTGVPNAGKSSLLNALLGFERVVVSPTSGTTRDLVDAPKIVGGWSFRFVDAAGLRDATDPIERAGTRLAVDAATRADVVLRLFDATAPKAEQESVFKRFFEDSNFAKNRDENAPPNGPKTLDVLNKIDLPAEKRAADWANDANWGNNENGAIWPISAKTERGVDELTRMIFAATVGEPEISTAGPLPWRADQVEFLNGLRAAVERGDFETAAAAFAPF